MRYIIILLSVFTLSANAGNVYVDPSYTGSTSTGSITQPWKSWGAIVWTSIVGGDTVFLRRGQKFTTGRINFPKSGSTNNPIVITGYGTGAKPHFWGNGTTLDYLFQFDAGVQRSWVTLDGLRIADTTIGVNDRSALSKIQRPIGTGNFITVKNCEFDRVGLGMYFPYGNNSFINNDVGNLRMIVSTPTPTEDDYGATGVDIQSENNLVQGNYFHDCYAQSFDYTWDGGGVEFFSGNADNNTIIYNTFYNNNGMFECGSSSGGTQSNNLVAYNKIINNGSFLLVQNRSDLFTVSIANFQVYNNVIIQNAVGVTGQSSTAMMRFRQQNIPPGTGLIVLRNNIIYITTGINWTRTLTGGVQQLGGVALTRSNNIYMVSGSNINYSLNGTEAIGNFLTMWQNTIGNAIGWNYNLQSVSQAINFGTSVGINTDFAGNPVSNPPDAGILEFVVPVPQDKNYIITNRKFVNSP